jgi:hypothetical protein
MKKTKKKSYSFITGLQKSGLQVAIFAGGLGLTYLYQLSPSLANTPVVDLVSAFLNKFIGGLTLGGLLTLSVNWLKNKDTR